MAPQQVTVQSIRYVGKPGMGAFQMGEQQLAWKGAGGGHVSKAHQWNGKDLQSAEWHSSCGGGHGLLKLRFNSPASEREIARFADFEASELERIREHLQRFFKVKLQEYSPSMKGWSWGDMDIKDEASVRLSAGPSELVMEVDISELSQVTTVGKHELNVELQDSEGEVLQGLRLFVPTTSEGGSFAEVWREELLQLTNVDSAGLMLGDFKEIGLVVPRGKHDLQFFPKMLTIRGKSQTYLVKWSSIKRILQVDLPDKRHKMLAVGVMPPLRNGNMQYDMIGMKIEISSTSDASISVPEEAWQKAKGNGLQKTRPKDFEEGEVPTFEAVGALLKELSGQNVIKPTDRFRVPDNTSSVPCSFATDSGHLFFFQKQLLFVPKPMYWRPYSRLEVVEFKDSLLRKSTFELVLTFVGEKPVEFKLVPRETQSVIFEFFDQSPELRDKIKDIDLVRQRLSASEPEPQQTQSLVVDEVPYDEDEDDDFEDDSDDEELEPQPKKKLRSRN